MNDPTPPLPQPSAATCPNCGAAQRAGTPYCTNCGAELKRATQSSLSPASKLIISLVLGFGALLFGAVGGCFVLLGRIDGSNLDPILLVFIGLPLLAALACIWGIFRVQRK